MRLIDASFFMSYQIHHTIKTWAEEDRPREKLLLRGHKSLTNAELLAILLGSGTKNCTAVELARKVLMLSENNLSDLGRLNISELTKVKGIGQAKAITILAALELGRRRQSSELPEETQIVRSKQAYELLAPHLADLHHEEFWVVLLNRRNVVLKYKCITQGGFAGTVVDRRQIFNWALEEKASSIILAHNHPSGALNPSEQDLAITKLLVEAGNILDIPVADHLIISKAGYFSIADKVGL